MKGPGIMTSPSASEDPTKIELELRESGDEDRLTRLLAILLGDVRRESAV